MKKNLNSFIIGMISDIITKEDSKPKTNSCGLQLSPIQVNDEYLKEWNEGSRDFIFLTKNGELVSNSLYRVGGFGGDINNDYFMLLKYVESEYDFDFIKGCYPDKTDKELELKRKHLEGRWCIIDKNGVEKKEFNRFSNPYIVSDSLIYKLDGSIYNIETDYHYCQSSKTIDSEEYIFAESNFDRDPLKNGVMRINKKDGTWKIYK